MNRTDKLENIQNVIFDLDGTIWKWTHLIEGAGETIDSLKERGINVYYITNNAVLSRAGFAKKLTNFGIRTKTEQVISASYIAAKTFARLGINKVYVIGESGLIEELGRENIKISDNCDHVLTALDRNVNYWKLGKACELIERGAKHWVTGTGEYWIIGDKIYPGDKAIAEGIRMATGKDYEVIGKPSDYAKHVFLNEFKIFPGESLLIGDRAATDIKFGNLMGMQTGLVMTGYTKKEDLKNLKGLEIPSFVFRGLKRILMKV